MFTTQDLPGFTSLDLDAVNVRVSEFIDLGFDAHKAWQMVRALLFQAR